MADGQSALAYGSPLLRRLESLDSLEGIARTERMPVPQSYSRVPGFALVHAVYPGLLAALMIALASTWLSQHYGAPVMLFALLFGVAFHFLHEDGRCVAGIEFASRNVLRVGVALLGARITANEIASLGLVPVATVALGVVTTIFIGTFIARRLGLGRVFGMLSGGSVAICGASAALAIAAVLPASKESERDTILVVVIVTALSTLAMILYPVLVGVLHLDHVHAGIFLGGTIHDVAQVVGAGYMISPETGDVATYVKLLRVSMLVPVVLVIALVMMKGAEAKPERNSTLVPLFLIGFSVLVGLNSFGLLPAVVVDASGDVSRWCLATAIAALGMKTSFKALFAAGWRPVGLMLGETLWIGGLVLASVTLLP